MHHSAVLSLAFCVFAASAQEAPKPQFTARELFYSAESGQPAKPAAQPVKPAPKPAAGNPKPNVAVKKPATHSQPAKPTQTAAVSETTPSTSRPAAEEPPATSGGVSVVKTAYETAPAPASGTPLGLRYTILKNSGDEMIDVPTDTVFHVHDKIQLSVQTNGPGYLYVIQKGTSGNWSFLFPSPEIADGDNHVDGWNSNTLPPHQRWAFDEQTGTELVFVVFSRQPEPSLENMIYSLQGGAKGPEEVKAQPANVRPPMDKPAKKKYVMTAGVDIPDNVVGQLRDTYTRDLVIEKVDDKTPQDKSSVRKNENAVYVVNPSGSADSRVVAEIKMVHQ